MRGLMRRWVVWQCGSPVWPNTTRFKVLADGKCHDRVYVSNVCSNGSVTTPTASVAECAFNLWLILPRQLWPRGPCQADYGLVQECVCLCRSLQWSSLDGESRNRFAALFCWCWPRRVTITSHYGRWSRKNGLSGLGVSSNALFNSFHPLTCRAVLVANSFDLGLRACVCATVGCSLLRCLTFTCAHRCNCIVIAFTFN